MQTENGSKGETVLHFMESNKTARTLKRTTAKRIKVIKREICERREAEAVEKTNPSALPNCKYCRCIFFVCVVRVVLSAKCKFDIVIFFPATLHTNLSDRCVFLFV
jgi:hypothetical protein